MIRLTQRVQAAFAAAQHVLELSAEERARSRLQARTTGGEPVALQLPRGTVLDDGDVLASDDGAWQVRIEARAEPVLTVRTADAFLLLRAAYHLGNRHVPLELGDSYLRLAPDSVLAGMLERMGLPVTAEQAPFHPEHGAYHGGHAGHAAHPHVFRAPGDAHG